MKHRSAGRSPGRPGSGSHAGPILFYGDPHEQWEPLVDVVLYSRPRPAAVVILGDCGLDVPLRRKLAAIWDLVPAWHWIIGNHDVDSLAGYEFLADSHPEGDIGGRIVHPGGVAVAGLGGVYAGSIWSPRFGGTRDAPPACQSRKDYLRQVKPADRFRNGLPLKRRATIFPEDHHALRRGRADVLVTHEAPSSHEHGFAGIDELAHAMRVRLVVHGHHHHSYEGRTADGIPVRGLGIAEPFLFKE